MSVQRQAGLCSVGSCNPVQQGQHARPRDAACLCHCDGQAPTPHLDVQQAWAWGGCAEEHRMHGEMGRQGLCPQSCSYRTRRLRDRAFREDIHQWREERGRGLYRFAKAVEVSPTFVSKMERGIGPLPGEATIRKMAEIFGENPDELLALGDKVAADMLAVITKKPAYARFLCPQAYLTKDQWEILAKSSLPIFANCTYSTLKFSSQSGTVGMLSFLD
jgi:transcriptional regulator with XRE-family HTH domain